MKTGFMYRWFMLVFLIAVLTGCGTIHKEVVSQSGLTQVASNTHEAGSFDITCLDANGNVKWQELDRHNALANEGEELIQNVFFRGATAPTGFFLRLYNTTPVLTSTLSTLSTYE